MSSILYTIRGSRDDAARMTRAFRIRDVSSVEVRKNYCRDNATLTVYFSNTDRWFAYEFDSYEDACKESDILLELIAGIDKQLLTEES